VIVLFAVGALSMLAQVVVLRELVAALFGVELLYVLALGAWLAGTAAGAAAGRRLSARSAVAAAGLGALGLLVPAELVLVRAAGSLTGAVPGAFLPFPTQVLWILAAALPPAVVCGLLFPPVAGMASARGTRLGRAYAIESAGAAAGGAMVTLSFWLGASTFQVVLVTSVLALGTAVAVAVRRRVWAVSLLALLAVALAWSASHARSWDLSLLRWQYPALVDAADTPYARVVVVRSHGQVAVFQNGAFAFDTEGTSAEAFADIAALQHPGPQRALVIGGGQEGVPDALHAHGIPSIDNIEIDSRAHALVRRHIPPVGRSAPWPAKTEVLFGEPRRLLDRAGPYDLMLVATGEPTSGASSRFYTREFFRQCARRLSPGGVLAVRLSASDSVWPRPLLRRTSSIVSAMRLEFASVEIVPGATLYLFASDKPLSSDPEVLAARLAARRVHARLMTPPYLRYLYGNDRRDEARRLLATAPAGGPNRDAAPVCYQYAAMLWLAKFYPELAVATWTGGRVTRWMAVSGIAVVLGGAVAWLRRGRRRRLVGLLFGAGLIGMVLETVLLLRYQVANGIVYQQVGWLLTCFMGGLAAGAWLSSRTGGSTSEASTAPWRSRLPAAALVAAALMAWASFALPVMGNLLGTSVMLLATGFIVGACFSLAAALWPGDRGWASSSLYAADVAGGSVGALAATVLLVPAAGLDRSALLMAVVAAILLLLRPRDGSAGR